MFDLLNFKLETNSFKPMKKVMFSLNNVLIFVKKCKGIFNQNNKLTIILKLTRNKYFFHFFLYRKVEKM